MVAFTLFGETSFTYTVTASDAVGDHDFSGTLRDFDRQDFPVGGDSTVIVEATATPTATPTPTPTPEQEGANASRSFDEATVQRGEQVVVTISASNYGQAGGVTETLPEGFSYISSSLIANQVEELTGGRVRFTLQGDTSFTYVVMAADTAGDYDFEGTLRDFSRNDHTVGGDSTVTIEAVTPSASRSFSASTVEPGGQVVVTISVSNYGKAGAITEALPAGFSYESSSLSASQVEELSGGNVRFHPSG